MTLLGISLDGKDLAQESLVRLDLILGWSDVERIAIAFEASEPRVTVLDFSNRVGTA